MVARSLRAKASYERRTMSAGEWLIDIVISSLASASTTDRWQLLGQRLLGLQRSFRNDESLAAGRIVRALQPTLAALKNIAPELALRLNVFI
jgi:hypothetical protein